MNNRDNTRSQNFTYDSLNRIVSGNSTGTQWGETFTIDAWSNMTNEAGIAGKTSHEGLNTSVGANNRLTGFGYDAARNMTGNGTTSYVYDAENRLVWTSGYRYLYDADGNRVEKCVAASSSTACPTSGTNGTLYWRGTGSDPLDETDLSGNPQEEYIFFNGQRIARRTVDSTGATIAVHYYFSDHLGSHGVIENGTGTACEQDIDYYPYGGQQHDYCSTQVPQHYKFTGKERDSESGLDNFGARYDASSLGRFMTPDPIGGSLANPQTLNKYSYVANNPINSTDPTGLYMCKDSKDCSSAADVKFEKTLDALRNSSDSDVARAAAAYGGVNKDNGVTVGFADLSKKGENGSTVSKIGGDSQGPRAESDVTINSKINGDSYAAAIGHEGSHAADAQDVVKSGLTGGLLAGQPIYAGMDITHYNQK